jgi:hypothetical protein
MKCTKMKFHQHLLFGFLAMTQVLGCGQFSEHVSDKSAGLNGGFEISQDGLPVNWLIYTPATVKDSSFDVVFDREVFKEGRQSLRFDVDRCSSVGGHRSPGLTNEFYEIGKYRGEGRYRLSFWIKNSGTEFAVAAGGVSAKKGSMRTLVRDSAQIREWRRFEYTIEVPEKQWLRMELNILRPGTFWIDGIEITKVDQGRTL